MRRVIISALLMVTILATALVDVSAKEVKLSMSETKENIITNFTVPIPTLGDFKVYIKLRTETQGDLTVDLTVNKQIISPGDELEIYIKPISGRLKINRTPILEVIDPKGKTHKKELTTITDEKDFPGQFDISIPLPISDILKVVIAYYTGGGGALIPIPNIGANVYGTVKTYPKVYIKAEGCYPELSEVTLYSSKPETVRVKKIEGAGAKIILDSWNLNSVIQANSDIYGGEYKGEISPISYKLVDKKEKVNTVIATLKTPIQIKLNEIKTVELGEKTLISGFVEPKTSINLKILCDNNIIATIRSSSDGKFDYIWTPKVVGKHFIKVVHDGSEFTEPAESNVVTVIVKNPPTPTKTTIVTPSKTSTKTQVSETTPPEKTKIIETVSKKTPGFEIVLAISATTIALALRRKI